VEAVVRDRAGVFMTDLHRDDFEVLEGGEPQKVEALYLVVGNVPRSVAGEEARGPGVPGGRPAVTIVVFDLEHMQPGHVGRARAAADRLFSKSFGRADIGGVVAGGRMVNNRLTNDRRELAAAARAVQPMPEGAWRRGDLREWPGLNEWEAHRIVAGDRFVRDHVVQRACRSERGRCLQAETLVPAKASQIVAELRTTARRTLQTIGKLAAGLSRLPARKSIVLLTGGFFTEDSWADLRSLSGICARASVRLYTLDTRGLDRGSASSDILTAARPGEPAVASFDTLQDGPTSLAEETGGLAIRNENDFDEALREMLEDSRSYYVLGYRPSNATADGKYRSIAVKVKRPGMDVRARKGYVASAAPPAH
jgi:VWFA-related protein